MKSIHLHISVILFMIIIPIEISAQKNGHIQKAKGDTIFYEDFSDQGLSNWTVIDSTNLGHNWVWSNSAPGGQYSTNIPALNSPTSVNGFISMRADFYNTPFPSTGPINMDAWIISDAIPLNAAAELVISYRQFIYYCCSMATSRIEMQVSTDSSNWIAYNSVPNNLGRTAPSQNGDLRMFNLTSQLSGEDTAYIRFRFSGAGWYFWMIDDLTILQQGPSALSVEEVAVDVSPRTPGNIHYTRFGNWSTCDIGFAAVVKNVGIFDQSNVNLNINLRFDSTLNGSAGGLNLPASAFGGTILFNNEAILETFISIPAFFLLPGYYTAEFTATSDSINSQSALPPKSISFVYTGDTTLARDLDSFSSSYGPLNEHSPKDGDKLGTIIGIDSIYSFAPVNPTSISVYIDTDTNNIGVSISPRLWSFQSNTVGALVLSSPLSHTILARDLGTWISLPFIPSNSLGGGLYVAGVEQTAGENLGKGFVLGRDVSAEQFNWSNSAMTFLNDPSIPQWISKNVIVGIRLNGTGACEAVGLEDEANSSKELAIFPNPSNGLINIEGNIEFDQIEVRDLNGRLVHFQNWKKNNQSIDLSFLDNGLYFLRLIGTEKDRVEKVVLQK